MKLKMTSFAVAAALFGASAAPAFASNEAMMDLLKVLRDKGTISAQDYELLSNAAKADEEVVNDAVNRVAKVEKSAKKSKAASWAEKVKIKGDMRFRYENRNTDDQQDDDRLRIRARIGAYADVNSQTKVGIRLATGGASATSTNQTLDDAFTHQSMSIDLGYIDWAPEALGGDSRFIFGKMKKPWQKVNDLIWDGDTNPEGIAYVGKFKLDGFTLIPSVGYYQLRQDSLDTGESFLAGQNLVHAQLAAKIGKKNTVGVSYYGFENNTVGDADSSHSEERMWEIFGQAPIPGTPLTVFGSYVNNSNADATGDDDDAFSLGAKAKFGSFKTSYEYRDSGINAVNGNFDNSDFENDSKGHILKAGYKIDNNFSLGATYFITERNTDDRERDLFQLDLKAKF